MTGRPGRVLPLAAAALGIAVTLVMGPYLLSFDDSCPGYDDEGPMAAPDSPYVQLMCEPAGALPGVAVGAGVALLLAVVLVRRRVGGPRRALGVVAVLLAPALVLGLLHVGLPRDCLSGRTQTGECSRDREMSY